MTKQKINDSKTVILRQLIKYGNPSLAEMLLQSLRAEVVFYRNGVEEYDDIGRLMRSCSGEVSVNKCDGMCTSQVRPSIGAPTGFIK
ncbi:Bursicon beta subunit, partial [Operophtera brumata]